MTVEQTPDVGACGNHRARCGQHVAPPSIEFLSRTSEKRLPGWWEGLRQRHKSSLPWLARLALAFRGPLRVRLFRRSYLGDPDDESKARADAGSNTPAPTRSRPFDLDSILARCAAEFSGLRGFAGGVDRVDIVRSDIVRSMLERLDIRAAGPEDAQALVPLVHSSGPSTFDYVFVDRDGVSCFDVLLQALSQKDGEHGYGHHFVAIHEGEVVGGGACFDGIDARRHTMAAIRQIFSYYGLRRSLGVIRRGLQTESVVCPPKGELHYIGHLGVFRDWRGRGVGAQLVDFLLEIGRTKGRKRAALDVSVENPRAEALYRRLGFEVTSVHESSYESEYGRVPTFRRMEIAL